MAWIELDLGLCESPEVLTMCGQLDAEPHQVIGPLAIVWGWVDDHGRMEGDDAVVESITVDLLKRRAACPPSLHPYIDAMVEVGWLVERAEGLRFPNYRRHAPKGCRRDRSEWGRNLRNRRDQAHPQPSPQASGNVTDAAVAELVTAWNDATGGRIQADSNSRRRRIDAAMQRKAFRDNYPAALERLTRSAFLTGKNRDGWKASLDWFITDGNVEKIMDGNYDDNAPAERKPRNKADRRQRQRVEALLGPAPPIGPTAGQ